MLICRKLNGKNVGMTMMDCLQTTAQLVAQAVQNYTSLAWSFRVREAQPMIQIALQKCTNIA